MGDLVWCNGGRDFYPAEHFAAGVPGTFEGRTIQNPIGYHSYLQKLYGDYMQLPPPEERVYRHDAVFIDLEHSYKQYKGIHYCVDEKKA